MKKIFLIVLMLLAVTGCKKEETIVSNCDVFECIKNIDIDDSVSDINVIIGIDGTETSTNEYYWKLSEDSGLKAEFNSSGKANITIVYNQDEIANSDVDFSKYVELFTKVKNGIVYSDFITYIGNIEGTIIAKNNSTTEYIWVNAEGKYLKAKFNNDSNSCDSITSNIS